MTISWTVFSKPWPDLSAGELGKKAADWGFDGIELPVREGFQVGPAEAERDLPVFAKTLSEHGVRIHSVASSTAESIFAACAQAGVPMIRVMIPVGPAGYLAMESETRRWLDAVVPLCQRYGVRVGIQPHHGRFVSDAAGLRQLIEPYPSECVAAVWDAAHNALAGQRPEYSLEILWSHLAMVNLKNVYYRRTNGFESDAEWTHYYTSGRQGLADWGAIARILIGRSYQGPICLTAEYTARDKVDELIGPDLQYAKAFWESP